MRTIHPTQASRFGIIVPFACGTEGSCRPARFVSSGRHLDARPTGPELVRSLLISIGTRGRLVVPASRARVHEPPSDTRPGTSHTPSADPVACARQGTHAQRSAEPHSIFVQRARSSDATFGPNSNANVRTATPRPDKALLRDGFNSVSTALLIFSSKESTDCPKAFG